MKTFLCPFKGCGKPATHEFEFVEQDEDGNDTGEQYWDVCVGHFHYMSMSSGKISKGKKFNGRVRKV